MEEPLEKSRSVQKILVSDSTWSVSVDLFVTKIRSISLAYLFADDTNLLYADRDINSLERVVNAELSKVQEWLVAIRLTLNAKKSNFVIFHPHPKKLDRDVILRIFDIETKDFVPLDQETYKK